jgi:uncharacterized membrane protein YvbJ
MIYCQKCGAKNEDTADKCVQCGESLYLTRPQRSRREEEMCFGRRGPLGSVFGGIVLILIGFAFLAQQMYRIPWERMGFVFLIVIGLAIIIGAIVSYPRR